MRQAHPGGEKLFVDYADDRAPVVIDRLTGEIREAWIPDAHHDRDRALQTNSPLARARHRE
jgi:transposase